MEFNENIGEVNEETQKLFDFKVKHVNQSFYTPALTNVRSNCLKFMEMIFLIVNVFYFICGLVIGCTFLALLVKIIILDVLISFIEFKMAIFHIIVSAILLITAAVMSFFIFASKIKFLLAIYFSFLFASEIIMFMGGVVGIIYKSHIDKYLARELKDAVILYSEDLLLSYAWDHIQKENKCCGFRTPKIKEGWKIWQIYNPVLFNRTEGNRVPESCCKVAIHYTSLIESCEKNPSSTNAYTDKECFEIIKDRVFRYTASIIGVGMGFSFIILPGAMLTCFMFLRA